MTDIREADFNNAATVQMDQYEDYFGFGEERVFVLPDGKQQIFFKIMNEGERSKFQKKTNKDIKFNRASGDASIKADQAEERRELILTSVTNWTLVRRSPDGWIPVPFSGERPGSELDKWLQVANPKIIDDLEFAIRQANPWMQADMSVEEIDKEIDRLNDIRKQAVEREQGK